MPQPTRRFTRRPRTVLSAVAACLAGAMTSSAPAADWPQFRGPNVDGTTNETISAKWPAGGPKELWRVPVGPGLGTFAVSGKDAYLFVERGGKEVCVKLNADTGKEVWTADIGQTANDKAGNGGPMPRSTPSVDGDRVYVFSTQLALHCLNAADGKPVWKQDLMTEFAGRNIGWQNAASPVVDGDRVFVAGGGPNQSFLAFNKADGSLLWKTGDAKITHATPVVATIHGVRQVIFFTQKGLIAVGTDKGQQLWQFEFPFKVSTASTPIVGGKNGDLVYCSAGYGVGSGVCRVSKQGDGFTAEKVWQVAEKNDNANHWTTPVHKDGYLYGIFGFKNWGKAPLKCYDMETGKEMWSQPGFGSGGGTVLAGNVVVAQADTGKIVLVEATPEAYRPLAESQTLRPEAPYGTSVKERAWTAAVVANGRIYARSTSRAVCLDVSGK